MGGVCNIAAFWTLIFGDDVPYSVRYKRAEPSRSRGTRSHDVLELHFRGEIARLPVETLRQYVRSVLRASDQVVTVDAVADKLGFTRQHLARLCRSAHLPYDPHWYLSTARLLAAAQCLEHADACVNHVAMELRFGEPSALYGMFRRYTGMTLPVLRQQGIWAHMEGLYRQALTPIGRQCSIESMKGSNEVIGGSI